MSEINNPTLSADAEKAIQRGFEMKRKGVGLQDIAATLADEFPLLERNKEGRQVMLKIRLGNIRTASRSTPIEKKEMKDYYRQNKPTLRREMDKNRKKPGADKPGGVSRQKRKHYGSEDIAKALLDLAKDMIGE